MEKDGSDNMEEIKTEKPKLAPVRDETSQNETSTPNFITDKQFTERQTYTLKEINELRAVVDQLNAGFTALRALALAAAFISLYALRKSMNNSKKIAEIQEQLNGEKDNAANDKE